MAVLFYAPICTNCTVHEILSHINRCLFITGTTVCSKAVQRFPTATMGHFSCYTNCYSRLWLAFDLSHLPHCTQKSAYFRNNLQELSCLTDSLHHMCFSAEVNLQSRGPAWLASQIIKCWLQHHLSLCLWDPGNYHKHFCESPASPALADTMVEDETPPRTFLLAPWPTWLLSSGLSMAHEKEWYSIIICCHN